MITADRELISQSVQAFLASHHIPLIDKPFDIDALLETIERVRDEMERHETQGSAHIPSS